MPDEQTQGTTQSSQGTQGQSTSAQGSGATQTSTQGSTATQTTSTQTGQTEQQTTAPARPADLPEAFWDAQKNAVNTAKINEMIVANAANESRRLSLPQKSEDVSLDLPKEFKLPQGVDFKFDPAKPEYNKFRELVVAEGISQATATKLTGLFAEIMVGDQASIQAFETAEIAKLGANGPARATAVKTGMTGMIGEALAGHLQVMTRTAGGVQALEAILAKFSSQGAASFSQAHREPGQGGNKVSEEQWATMSPAARLDYSRQFDQSQFQKTG